MTNLTYIVDERIRAQDEQGISDQYLHSSKSMWQGVLILEGVASMDGGYCGNHIDTDKKKCSSKSSYWS